MTPSNSSSAQSFSRTNPCPLGYSQPKPPNLLRSLFARTPAPGLRKVSGPSIGAKLVCRDLKNGTATSEGVPEFLHEKMIELLREQRTERPGPSGTDLGAHLDGHAVAPAFDGTEVERASAPIWKRVLDLTLIALTSPIWLPVILLLMLAVRFSSPGPIFYRQERVGYRGRRFLIYKFRSMKVDSETHVHEAHLERLMRESVPMVKLDGKGDPRILPWGRLMRATALDELPQIFNVIRGEMSLVGPRPCTIHEFARYAKWQQERVNALPGLTGYWQVNGKNRTTFNEMIEMDIHYSKHMSIGMDLAIIFQTMPALIDQTLESFSHSRTNRPPFPSDAKTPEGI